MALSGPIYPKRFVMRMFLCAAAMVFTISVLAAQEKPAVREIPTRNIFNVATTAQPFKVTEPKVFTSAAELNMTKLLTQSGKAALIKQVNFDKEKVVLFFWSWAGGDKIVPVEDKPGSFTHSSTGVGKGGFGDKLFVVPKDAEIKVTQEK